MYDCIRDVVCGNRPATNITQQWQQTNDISFHMLYFLENHDEQRLASDFFAGNAKKGIPALMVCSLMRGNPFMLYAGQEYGEKGMDEEGFSGRDGRTTIFDYWSTDSLIHGFFARRKMTSEEKAIEAEYKKYSLLQQRNLLFPKVNSLILCMLTLQRRVLMHQGNMLFLGNTTTNCS